jgi:hypothetical protein
VGPQPNRTRSSCPAQPGLDLGRSPARVPKRPVRPGHPGSNSLRLCPCGSGRCPAHRQPDRGKDQPDKPGMVAHPVAPSRPVAGWPHLRCRWIPQQSGAKVLPTIAVSLHPKAVQFLTTEAIIPEMPNVRTAQVSTSVESPTPQCKAAGDVDPTHAGGAGRSSGIVHAKSKARPGMRAGIVRHPALDVPIQNRQIPELPRPRQEVRQRPTDHRQKVFRFGSNSCIWSELAAWRDCAGRSRRARTTMDGASPGKIVNTRSDLFRP